MRVEFEIDGVTHWYDQQQEIALREFQQQKQRLIMPMEEALKEWLNKTGNNIYDQDLIDELIRYPMTPDQCTPAKRNIIFDFDDEDYLML